MKTSGHCEQFIRQAVEQGIRNFDDKVKRSRLETNHPGFQPLYPKAGWRKDLRSKEKAMKRGTWFRGDQKDGNWKDLSKTVRGVKRNGFLKAGKAGQTKRAASTVVFVPSTKGSILIKSLKEDEQSRMAEMTGFKIKFQEAGGSVLANSFDKDLGKGKHCGRAPCPPCDSSDKRVNCRSRNIVYESKCRECNPVSSQKEDPGTQSRKDSSPREGIYIGETSHSLHERAVEHVRDAESFSAKSHIVKHWMNAHENLPSPPKMEFSITAKYGDCLSRQIGEALRIHYSKDVILNSKSEYMSNTISRLTIEEDAWERKERSRLEEEQEALDKVKVERFKRLKTSSQQEDVQVEYETDEDEFEEKDLPNTGGPCHLYGGGRPIIKQIPGHVATRTNSANPANQANLT